MAAAEVRREQRLFQLCLQLGLEAGGLGEVQQPVRVDGPRVRRVGVPERQAGRRDSTVVSTGTCGAVGSSSKER